MVLVIVMVSKQEVHIETWLGMDGSKKHRTFTQVTTVHVRCESRSQQ